MATNVFGSGSGAQRRAVAQTKKSEPESPEIPIMIAALKKIYREKVLPFEERYSFPEFTSPSFSEAWFEAKPFVLLVGQYSVGKTTFIKYLLERDFPNIRIGPEPTTDRFVVIMDGPKDRIIPGNALAADSSKPFTELTKFGMGFLNRFECAECKSPILDKVSFIDTPGVLSGEKQRIGRQYDFAEMVAWFADRCDRILLLFDAHKLDISDEFRMAIEAIRTQDEKIRVVLNKADMPTQRLMRVYGALMWSLGKVFNTPEVLRVFVGSFWDGVLANTENAELLACEEKDLLADLRSLPRNVAIRKLNEVIKRARRAKVHSLIVLHLKEQFGYFGKDKKQKKLLENLRGEFDMISAKHNLPKGDFPNVNRFRENLSKFEIHKFPKMDKKILAQMDSVISQDMPKLMSLVPSHAGEEEAVSADAMLNPFDVHSDRTNVIGGWAIDQGTKESFDVEFAKLPQTQGRVSGANMRPVLLASGFDTAVLRDLWTVSDIDQDGWLDSDEFAVALFLIQSIKKGLIKAPPSQLPDRLIPPSKRHLFEM